MGWGRTMGRMEAIEHIEQIGHITRELTGPIVRSPYTRYSMLMLAFVLLVAPYAPHLAEELWQTLGHDGSLAYQPWPQCDEQYLHDETVEVPVQIGGKLRSKIVVAAGLAGDDLRAAAANDPRIAELLVGKEIVKAVVVPGRLVNFVVK